MPLTIQDKNTITREYIEPALEGVSAEDHDRYIQWLMKTAAEGYSTLSEFRPWDELNNDSYFINRLLSGQINYTDRLLFSGINKSRSENVLLYKLYCDTDNLCQTVFPNASLAEVQTYIRGVCFQKVTVKTTNTFLERKLSFRSPYSGLLEEDIKKDAKYENLYRMPVELISGSLKYLGITSAIAFSRTSKYSHALAACHIETLYNQDALYVLGRPLEAWRMASGAFVMQTQHSIHTLRESFNFPERDSLTVTAYDSLYHALEASHQQACGDLMTSPAYPTVLKVLHKFKNVSQLSWQDAKDEKSSFVAYGCRNAYPETHRLFSCPKAEVSNKNIIVIGAIAAMPGGFFSAYSIRGELVQPEGNIEKCSGTQGNQTSITVGQVRQCLIS